MHETAFTVPVPRLPVLDPLPTGQPLEPAGQNFKWSEAVVAMPKKSGSVLKTLSVNTLPSDDLHPVPVDVAMTVVAVLVYPCQGLQVPFAGREKFLLTSVAPPCPNPPRTAMQKFAACACPTADRLSATPSDTILIAFTGSPPMVRVNSQTESCCFRGRLGKPRGQSSISHSGAKGFRRVRPGEWQHRMHDNHALCHSSDDAASFVVSDETSI